MKFVVTGGAGFIGTNFTHFLANQVESEEIRVIDKLTYAGNKDNILQLIESGQVKFFQNDICDTEKMKEILSGSDIVFHFAAESHVDNSIEGPKPFLDTNVMGSFSLLEALRSLESPPKFVQISTDEVYGELIEDSCMALSFLVFFSFHSHQPCPR